MLLPYQEAEADGGEPCARFDRPFVLVGARAITTFVLTDFGALSVLGGKVEINWFCEDDALG